MKPPTRSLLRAPRRLEARSSGDNARSTAGDAKFLNSKDGGNAIPVLEMPTPEQGLQKRALLQEIAEQEGYVRLATDAGTKRHFTALPCG